VNAGRVRLLHVADIVKGVGRSRVSDDGVLGALRVGERGVDAAWEKHDGGGNGRGFAFADGEDGELAIAVDLPCAVKTVAIAGEAHGREAVEEIEFSGMSAVRSN